MHRCNYVIWAQNRIIRRLHWLAAPQKCWMKDSCSRFTHSRLSRYMQNLLILKLTHILFILYFVYSYMHVCLCYVFNATLSQSILTQCKACINHIGTCAGISATVCSTRLDWCVNGLFELIYPQIFITSITVRKRTTLNLSRHITCWWLISFIMITCISWSCCRGVHP